MLYIKDLLFLLLSSLLILYPVTDYVIGFANEYTVNGKTFTGMSLILLWNNWS